MKTGTWSVFLSPTSKHKAWHVVRIAFTVSNACTETLSCGLCDPYGKARASPAGLSLPTPAVFPSLLPHVVSAHAHTHTRGSLGPRCLSPPPCAPQVFLRDHELPVSWEAMADQAEQCGTHLSALRAQAAGPVAGHYRRGQRGGHPL